MIRNFSLRQRLHLLLELLYGECDERMRQEIKCSKLLSLRVQVCLLSSVEFSLGVALVIASPQTAVVPTTKQACKDELVVYLFFFSHI